ncbi:hypothetical protein QE374_002158 [Microbacterium sp. SORGH_AS428]|uniref:hypothetical protein n=1 Tax=Microbacterium sp. SORGH_AS_0428 TaxID=3041788 RepID=UPI002857E3BD|nr:hypothetical protein [Microbacterium sp. SORGH_AS_0428]MDR6200249.1 hypothetical protein [Microbacterium sp. SORGH_AS_0428]
MSTATWSALGGGMTPAAETVLPGRTLVAERALVAVCEQVAARAMGLPRREVSVRLGATAGALAVRVEAPLPVPDLSEALPSAQSETVTARGHRIREQIRTDVAALTGREVRRIDLTITGARIEKKRRVR